ncbi:Armadillo repeat-containing protein 3 [Rhizoclosmatium hyalinum]|nr:Armadillo repeat-containing protein 3 [Rhizoclosmatium hyalinum]
MEKCDPPANFAISDLKTLILLLQSPDPPICVQALEALTKYAEHRKSFPTNQFDFNSNQDSKHRVKLLGLGIMNSLLKLTSSKEIDRLILSAAEIHVEMRRRDLLETIVSLLATQEPPEVQDEAAFTIANLAKDFALKADIRKAGGVKALVKLLPSTDPDVKKNVALALSSLLEDCKPDFAIPLLTSFFISVTNRSEIRYVNGLAPLLELLGADFPEIQENTLMSLILSAEDRMYKI